MNPLAAANRTHLLIPSSKIQCGAPSGPRASVRGRPLRTRGVVFSWHGRRAHAAAVRLRTPVARPSNTTRRESTLLVMKGNTWEEVLRLGAAVAGLVLLATPSPALAGAALSGAHGASLGVAALHHIVSGGLAGSAGAAAVYPIDVVKTRMQAQKRSKNGIWVEGSTAYASSWDCFTTILRTEGVSGMYSGLLAQLIGVWPDKAAKLSANEYMLGLLADPVLGTVSPLGQLAAGMFAGLCQVVFSNPREIVKIQMQMMSVGKNAVRCEGPAEGDAPQQMITAGLGGRRLAAPVALSVMSQEQQVSSQLNQMRRVLRELGLRGLYRGAPVCAARDMTFSAIYFPIYGFLKTYAAAHGLSGSAWIMVMGTLAGIPASFCTNPVDIIKTRVQAEREGRPGRRLSTAQHTRALLEEGGVRSLFQGVAPRVIRTALQFGFTLVVYENINAAWHWN